MGTVRTARAAVVAAVVTCLVGTLAVTGPASASPTRPDRGPEQTDQQRREHGLSLMPDRDGTPVIAAEPSARVPAPSLAPMPAAVADDVQWPTPTTSVVEVAANASVPGARALGDALVQVTEAAVAGAVGGTGIAAASSPATDVAGEDGATDQVRVQVLDRAAAADVGVDGVLMRLDRTVSPQGDGSVDVTVDYTTFTDAYGGDWSSRLRLVLLPDCAVSTPEVAGCREQTPIESTNDAEAMTVTATVAPESMGVMALSAAASGPAGSWSATPLSPSAAWQVSAQTGDFAWSYPMRVPPAIGGPSPDLALSYSAGSLDGRVASTNNQTSWIGDGWDLTTGYVERTYVPCWQDTAGAANNATHKTGDLCWSTDNATLVFGGKASELVKDAATGTWHVKADDGTKIEHLTGGWSADNDGEYWKVTTLDGVQFLFGRERRSATDTTAMNSAWTVPVFGNHPGEPCYNPSFADSACTQGWRWNLEYVVDLSGNTLTYVYAKEINNYGRNANTAVSTYVRGGYLTRIDYGQRAGSEAAANAPARVEFTVAERCVPSGSITCDPGQLTAASASSWPDVPFDLICTSATSCPAVTSPAFFTRKRLTTVTTRVLSGAAYQNVDTWTLTHTFPDPGDATNAALWLEAIGHQGLVGTAITLPNVTFHGVQMANRVDTIGDAGPPMNRYRINAIDTETGATISVNYTGVDCTTTSLPASPETNTRRCFPVRWTPEGTGGDIQEYFHKYLVTSVVADGRDTTSQATETHYSYLGDPAWRYDDNPLVPVAQRTWGQFRGYGTVEVITGAPTAAQRSATRYRYFRGMDGDHLPGGATRTVSIDGIADQDRLNGFVREQITYDGVGGPEVSGVLTTPWVSPPTASGSDGVTATLLANGISEERITASAAPGGKLTTRTVTTYDSTYGLPTQVDDQGDTSTATDDQCTRIEYVPNPAAHVFATIRRSETVAVNCATTPTRPGNVIGDSRVLYDGGGYGVAPARGLVTGTQRLSTYSGDTPVYVTESTTTYDAHGRATSATDALGRTTTTAYTPATGGPVTRTTVTSPDPDGTGPGTAQVTSTDVNPAWGAPVKVSDPNAKVTTATYDALGRVTAVWLPGRPQATKTANATYAYTVSATGPNAVTTKSLTASETYLTSVELLDGLLRPRQTQSPSAARATPGRVVTDTVYDTRGLVEYANGSWFTTGAPSVTPVTPTEAVPARTRYVYDGAERVTTEIFDVGHQERWRTTTSYDGDRVSVDPPTGAVPQTTITNARGQVTELRQYTGPAPTGAYQATTYAYDPAGNLSKVTDAAGNRWTYTFDLRGRQTGAADPDKGATTTAYDDAGQVTASTDARGLTLAYTRDQLGRTTSVREGSVTGPQRATWIYDTLAKGQLTSSTRYDGGAAYVTAVTGYDDAYRPLGQSVTIPSVEGAIAGTYTTSYTYTPDGQLKTIKLPTAGPLTTETVTTFYDALSMPEWMSGGLGWGVYVAGSLYSSYGQPMMYDLGNTYAQFVNYSYEYGTDRLDKTWLLRENVAGYDLDLTYTYDQAGNPTSIVDRPTSKPVDAQCFVYDGLRRLTRAWTPADANCTTAPSAAGLGGPAPYWTDDTFDTVGNRTTQMSHVPAGNTTRTYAYPTPGSTRPHALTQVTATGPTGTTTSTYAYDAAGNTATRARAGQPIQTLAWDAEGELGGVTQSGTSAGAYVYTADGDRLVRRQGGKTTVYLPGGQELTLTTATGVLSAMRYYAFNGATVAMRTAKAGSAVSSVVSDPHATAEIAIANTTNVLTRRRLDPYGNPRGTTPVWPGDHGYLNKPTDTTGLTQVGARYYDPAVGRFVSVDPVMDLTDPQQWHGYAYANNNPITYADPTGLIGMLGDYGTRTSKHSGGAGAPAAASPAATTATTVRPPIGSCAGPQYQAPSVLENLRTGATRIGDWAVDNRGTLATIAATAGCFVPAVGQAMCGFMQAGAFAVRSQQTIANGGGLNGQTAAMVGADLLLTGTGLGLARTLASGATMTGNLTRAQIAAARLGPSTQVIGTGVPTAIAASTRVAPWAGPSLSRLSTEGETMYRVWGGVGARQAGAWVTPIRPASAAAAREGLALPSENAAAYVSRVTLPVGVRMQVGTAGPAFGQPGGWAQAQLLENIPTSAFGKGELLP